MRLAAVIGVALILGGVGVLASQGVVRVSRRSWVEFRPLSVSVDRRSVVPVSPVVALAAVAGGVALLVGSVRRPR